MRRYMWPNSCLPSATTLITAMNVGSQGRFTLEGVENHAARESNFYDVAARILSLTFPPDYPRTLREWGRRLEANLTQDLLVKDYPTLSDNAEYAVFKRKWQYLFAYAGAGFAKGYITCHMLTFIRQVSTNYTYSYQSCSNLTLLRMTFPNAVIEVTFFTLPPAQWNFFIPLISRAILSLFPLLGFFPLPALPSKN